MAEGTITPPPGFVLEGAQPPAKSAVTPPPGFVLEGQQSPTAPTKKSGWFNSFLESLAGSTLNEPDPHMGGVPAEWAMRELLPKEEMKGSVLGVDKETLAGLGIGAAKGIETVTNPGVVAGGVALGALGSVGLPGLGVTAGLSADMLHEAYKKYKQGSELPPDALPREKTASKTGAAIDAIFAALPWLHRYAGAKEVGPIAKPITVPELKALPRQFREALSTSVPEKAPIVSPEAPIVSPKPPYVPGQVPEWRKARDAEGLARADSYQKAQESAKPPAWVGEPTMPSNPLSESMVAPVNPARKAGGRDPLNSLLDAILFEGGVSPKNLRDSGLSGEWAAVGDMRRRIGRNKSHLTIEELADAVRGHGYTDITDHNVLLEAMRDPERLKRGLRVPEEDQIYAMQEQWARDNPSKEVYNDEGYLDYQASGLREPGEEGFADILPFRRSSKEKLPLGKLIADNYDHIQSLPKQDALAFVKSLLDQAAPMFPGEVKKGKFGNQEGFAEIGSGPAGNEPERQRLWKAAVAAMKREDNLGYDSTTQALNDILHAGPDWDKHWEVADPKNKEIIDAWARAKDAQGLKPSDWELLKAYYRSVSAAKPKDVTGESSVVSRSPLHDLLKSGEEGFAKIDDKNQRGFGFSPIGVAGQSKDQAALDLVNKILDAPDASQSKRDMLGLKNRKKKASAELGMFDEKGLFK